MFFFNAKGKILQIQNGTLAPSHEAEDSLTEKAKNKCIIKFNLKFIILTGESIMGEIKTKPTDVDIDDFLMGVEPEKRDQIVLN